jgi:PAS domain S-box-containing protein
VQGGEESIRAFIREAPVLVAMFDREMCYLAGSRRWLTTFAADEHNAIGQSFYDQSPGAPQRWKDLHRRVLRGEALAREQDEIVGRDGAKRSISWDARPWRQSSGEIGGITVFAEDVTAAVATEVALRDSIARAADEANALSTFHVAGARVWSAPSMREGLDEILAVLVETLR